MRLFEFIASKKVLVVGGAGPVGRILLPSLLAAKPSSLLVTARDTPVESLPEGIRFQVLRLPGDLESLPKDFDFVLDLAAVSKPDEAASDPKQAWTVNVDSVRHLLEHYAGTTARIVLASSVRSSESRDVYSATKIAVDLIGAAWSSPPTVTVVRLGNVLRSARVLRVYDRVGWAFDHGWLSSGSEYFQPSVSVLYTFHFGLAPSTETGTIVTPLLPRIPLMFLAGYLAGLHPDLLRRAKAMPVPVHDIPDVDLVPRWWYAYSRRATVYVTARNQDQLEFIATNLVWRTTDAESSRLAERVEKGQRQPQIAEFLKWLAKEGYTSKRRD